VLTIGSSVIEGKKYGERTAVSMIDPKQ